MTRREQIEKEATRVSYNYDEFSAFIKGAEWADEHPNLYNDEKYHTVKVSCLDELNRKAKLYDVFLEKACEWLLHQEEMIGSFSYGFIERFKKEMEG
jgi:hypothetical protein